MRQDGHVRTVLLLFHHPNRCCEASQGYDGREVSLKMPIRQKELLKEFCDLSGDNCNPDSAGFFNRVKQFWDDVTTDDGRPSA